MTPDYSTPLRVTWTVPADPEAAKALAKRLAEGRVLFVEAEITAATAAALAEAAREARGFKLTVIGSPAALARFADLCPAAAKSDGIALDWLGAEGAVAELAPRFGSLSVGLWSEDSDLAHFGQALALATSLGLPLALPNPHAPARIISERVKREVEALWNASPTKPKAVVHDLFLAEALGLDPFKHYKGCAAGTALAHLEADGTLTACRTMPGPLGNLHAQALKEIWRGEAAAKLREKLKKSPSSCMSCALVESCAGACPGLGGPDGRDGSCPGPREGGAQ